MTIIAFGSSFTYKLGTSLGQRQTKTIDWDYIRVYTYTPMTVDSTEWNLYE